MIIYPAIDMKGGRCVRLLQGRAQNLTDYGDPLVMARRWAQDGARWLHLVDLDGAFDGAGGNLDAVERIVRELDIPVQLGGGIRTMADVELRLERLGVSRVILGTAAVENPHLRALELALRMREAGVELLIYTDIARDGMMQGPSVESTAQMVRESGMQVIGSGGVSTLSDIDALRGAGCAGVITGKALYSGAFTLRDALKREEA